MAQETVHVSGSDVINSTTEVTTVEATTGVPISEIVSKNDVTTKVEQKKYVAKEVPKNNSFKSYMSYRAITNKSSKQYKLQQIAETGKYGIRTVNDRYCIAVGSYYTTKIGAKIDVVMENGAILKCILSDAKSDKHTDSKNQKAKDGSIIEFVVDTKTMDKTSKRMGNMSYCHEDFKGEIKEIRVYK